MDDSMPQDEYFEWEDIILYRAPYDVTTESANECRQTVEYSRTYTHTFEEGESEGESDDFQWGESEIGHERSASSSTTSIQTSFTFKSLRDSEKKDSPIDCPSYEAIDIGLGGLETTSLIVEGLTFPDPPATLPKDEIKAMPTFESFERPTFTETRDCSALCLQPCGNVNYLLHQWREDDVSASWRHIVTKTRTWGFVSQLDHSSWKRHNTVARLENASWRTWSKLRFGLKTVSPQTINWLKHCDDTCLYGPFSVSTKQGESRRSVSRDVRTPNDKSGSCTTTPSRPSILKKPSMGDILRRGSLPVYTVLSSGLTVSLQGQSLSDNSPLIHQQTSHQHVEFTTPLLTPFPAKHKKAVKFLSEVRQYIIVNPINDRKIHRTVQKTRSTTLDEEAYFLTPELEPELVELVSEQSYWSPDSLCGCNPNQNANSQAQDRDQEQQKDPEWTWLGVISEDDFETEVDYFSSKPVTARTAVETPYPYPILPSTSPSTSANSSSPDLDEGSLSYCYGTTSPTISASSSPSPGREREMIEEDVDDPIDYLLSCTSISDSSSSCIGSLSPSSNSASGSDEHSASDLEESEDDEGPAFAATGSVDTGLKVDGQARGLGMGIGIVRQRFGIGGEMGYGIGIMDDEKHRLYEQVMEEFNLEY